MSTAKKGRINKKKPIIDEQPEFNNRVEDLDGLRTVADTMERIPLQDSDDSDSAPGMEDISPRRYGDHDQRKPAGDDADYSGASEPYQPALEHKYSGTDSIKINLADGSQVDYPRCPMAIPRCYCGIRMRAGKVGKDGTNKNRIFFTCSKNDRSARCSSFAWVTNPRMISWLMNFPRDAAYNSYSQLHADEGQNEVRPKQTRVIRATVY